jgi:hypothetical protein
MWNVADKFKVRLGGNVYINVKSLITFKGESIFTLKRSDSDGLLGIDFDIFNKDKALVAKVRHGTVVYGDPSLYEVFKGNHHYKLTEKATGKVVCEIKSRGQAENAELDVSVKLYTKDGFLFEADPDKTNIGTANIRGNTFEGCDTAITIA